jgi:hypothetical protein
VPQVTQEDDQAYGIPGLHEIRPKVESLQNDFPSILGKDAVRFVQGTYAWYFTLFGYQTKRALFSFGRMQPRGTNGF